MNFLQRIRGIFFQILAAFLSIFILVEVNSPHLLPQSQLAMFGMLGTILVYLKYPIHSRLRDKASLRGLDFILAIATTVTFGYIIVQTEPMFKRFWIDGQPLGQRAGVEQIGDYVIGFVGILLVLEATRRAIGLALPILSLAFLLYAGFRSSMPMWLFPHKDQPLERIISHTFLQSQGVFGIALSVMFKYVFLFVLFGTLLEKTGATGYVIGFAKRLFRSSTGGAAKIAVLSSGMMGSLSGSAVANTATTGTFTIPLMKSVGFKPGIAGGVEAAASSGGALVPPIMGAGAYMMLEIVQPSPTYLEIIRAALIPAVLYYTALLLIVHFYAGRAKALAEVRTTPDTNADVVEETTAESGGGAPIRGFIFFIAFVSLLFFLIIGYTPFRSVSLSLLLILVLSAFNKQTRVNFKGILSAMEKAAHGGVSLVAAASCVGLILGVVTLTDIGRNLAGVLLPLAEDNLILALMLLMVSTIILGMGLPSSVCYLLMATLVGPILRDLGLVPLAAHMFIFYFGMMSMVTPPVALAAYAAAAIADAKIMQTAFAAFRIALVGFALPYAFVLRPELLLLSPDGGTAGFFAVAGNVLITAFGIAPLAASVSGYWFSPLDLWKRAVLLFAAIIFFFSSFNGTQIGLQGLAFIAVVAVGIFSWRAKTSDLS